MTQLTLVQTKTEWITPGYGKLDSKNIPKFVKFGIALNQWFLVSMVFSVTIKGMILMEIKIKAQIHTESLAELSKVPILARNRRANNYMLQYWEDKIYHLRLDFCLQVIHV